MTFEHDGLTFNLLDTPGHQDFSEDTYRTLTAVDSAVMVLDAAKGIETQTLKLFEVCRLRDVPIITFINKLDREARDPFDLLDEIERTLALDVTPASWPIGMGRDFLGTYDLFHDALLLFERGAGERVTEPVRCEGLDDPKLATLLPAAALAKLREEVAMARGLCPPFDLETYRDGHLTPVYFGSALNNFGVRELLRGIADVAPPPRPQPAEPHPIDPADTAVTGFVFKVQANMDPQHRDRVAFLRLCSGRFRRGMKLRHSRSGRQMAIQNPVFFLARDRNLAEEAWPGDIIGIPNHGTLRIGDTLTEGEDVRFTGIPNFAPEILRRVRLDDPMKAKHLSPRAGAARRGGRHPHLQAAHRRRLDRRRGGRAAARGAGRPHQDRVRSGRPLRAGALRDRALGRVRRSRGAQALPRRQHLHHGRGSRRRAGLSRPQQLGPRDDDQGMAQAPLHRHARAQLRSLP